MDEVEVPALSGPSRMAWIGATVAAFILIGFIAVLATSSTDRSLGASPLLAKTSPPITGQTIDGSTFDLDAERGRWVVVNFFATTCIPCVKEHPELVDFDEAHRDVGDAAVVSIAFSDSAKNVSEFFEKNGGRWAVLAEDTGRHAIEFGVAAVPETYLVSPTGTVTSKFIGGITRADIENEIARIDALLES